MNELAAVVELLPRIVGLPTPGDPSTYRLTTDKARDVRQQLVRELFAAVPYEHFFSVSVVTSKEQAFKLLAECDWKLSVAQQRAETVSETCEVGSSVPSLPEYSKNRRGMTCGHVFRKGEPIFRCHDCSFDDTCVQCATCFRHSIHAREDHDVLFSVADEGGACCDCGDEEAWNCDLGCEFHSLHPYNEPQPPASSNSSEQDLDAILAPMPSEVRASLSDFAALLLAFVLETLAHSPKQTPLVMGPDVVDGVKRQPTMEHAFPAKGKARQEAPDSPDVDTPPPLFVALLWNDEKHSFNEVSDKVLEVCTSKTVKEALHFAELVDRHGREVLSISDDVRRLVLMARRIGVIYLLVTVEPAFDYFVEEVAGQILQFLFDMAGCSFYTAQGASDGRTLKALLTQTFMRPWRVREWEEAPATIRRDLFDPTNLCMLDALLLFDAKLWKSVRFTARNMLMDLIACREAKRQVALRVASVYPRLIESFILHDREPEHSLYHLTVQLFSVPSIATQLVVERGFLSLLLYILQALFANEREGRITSLILPAAPPARGQANPDTPLLRQQKCYHIFYDIRYLLAAADVQRDIVRHSETYLSAWLEFFALFHSIAPDTRAVHAHVEFESELWIQVFHINSHLGRIAKLLGEAFVHANAARLCQALSYVGHTILMHLERLSSLDPITQPPLVMHEIDYAGHRIEVVPFVVSSQPVSFHHPMHWLFAEMLKHIHHVTDASLMIESLGEDRLLMLVDHPLRVAVKLAQIRCNVWVRNGFAIRSQAFHYRDSMWMRDIMYDQDLFLQQCALAFTSPKRFLGSLLDRFELIDWFSGRASDAHPVYDADQCLFMAEELFLLLAVLLNEIAVPAHWSIEAQVRRELVHYLVLGPCTYSELTKQVPERFTDHSCFDRELARVAHFREPDGSADHGMYELRPAFLADVQPLFHHYSRNQREKAEQVLSEKRAAGCTLPIYSTSPLNVLAHTPFRGLANIFLCPVLLDMLFYALKNATALREPPDTLLMVILHLIAQGIEEHGASFVEMMTQRRSQDPKVSDNLLDLLLHMSRQPTLKAYETKFSHIFDRAVQLSPSVMEAVTQVRGPPVEAPEEDTRRRQAARARQQAILQKFSAQQQSLLAELDDELSDDDMDEGFGTCILCQERLDGTRAFGSLVHVQESRLVRTSLPREASSIDDVLATPLNLDAGDTGQRARGTYKRVQEGAQLGYPASAHVTGLVAVTCGHGMHVSCFHTYLQSTEQRHALQVARQHPEDLSRFEYICPLCKSLGNMLLPEPGVSPLGESPFRQAPLGQVEQTNTPLAEWVRSVNISILKQSSANTTARTDHQDALLGTGRFLPWLVERSAQPHNPDLGLGLFAPDECHMLQRYTNVLQLLADETAAARSRDHQATILHASGELHDVLYIPDKLVAYTLAQQEIALRGVPQPITEAITPSQLKLVQTMLDALGASMRLTLHNTSGTHNGGIDLLRQGLLKRLLPYWVSEPAVRSPLLLRDPLGVLVEAAVLTPEQLAPITGLLYYVQIIQCVFGLAQPVSTPTKHASNAPDLDEAIRIFPYARWLATSIISLVGYVRGNMTLGFDQMNDRELAKVMCLYTLPFLRRAAILRRAVSGAIPAAPTKSADASTEYERLLAELQIPAPALALPMHSQSNELITMLMEGWTKHAYVHFAPLFRPLPIQPGLAPSVPNLVLEHPHIYELLPLQRDLTELLQQTQERKCPRCGTLPPTFSLCLFCGQVLCEQSYCCSDPDDESRGECNQHMEQCGGRVGMHFRVGSNIVVLLYQTNGAFSPSPYLNSHGEVDRYLLKARPQRLHLQRYDELRKQWLMHGLANVVTRRIEATIDHGGWTTF